MRTWVAAVAAGALISQGSILLPALQKEGSPPPAGFEPYGLEAAGTLVNALADFDGDSDMDLFVGFGGAIPNRLYRNDAGTLADVAGEAGVADQRATRAAAWSDFDADGDSDLLVGFAPGAGPVLRLYRNDGARFNDVTAAFGLTVDAGAVRQLSWVDFDADADVDLFVAFRDRPNALFRNDGGKLRDAAPALGLADPRKTVGAVWFDYDQDGDLDLLAGNMDGDANGLFRNDGGRFTDVAEAVGLKWGGRKPGDTANGTVRPCAADVDGDGFFDVVMANYGPLGLFVNKRDGRFEDQSTAWGIAIDARYDTCTFADFDHDGRLDMYVNGTVTGGVSYRDYLFWNAGSRFEDATPERLRTIEADHGAQFVDIDADGDEDLALTGAGKTAIPLLLRNSLAAAAARRSLKVRVLDSRGRAVLAGAEVRVYAREPAPRAAGQPFAAATARLLGTRLVDSGSSYNSQSDIPVHFGLAAESQVDVEVTWPAAGKRLVSRVDRLDPASLKGQPAVVRLR
ncbi:MAG: CRTAC1 family protein [Vicinamibacterales bacterium]